MRKHTHIDIELNGRTFETNTNEEIITPWNDIYKGWKYYNTLWDAYRKPSAEKERVWNDWNDWFIHNWKYGDAEWWISAKTDNFFTITAKVRMQDGNKWYLRITYAHNYATRIH